MLYTYILAAICGTIALVFLFSFFCWIAGFAVELMNGAPPIPEEELP